MNDNDLSFDHSTELCGRPTVSMYICLKIDQRAAWRRAYATTYILRFFVVKREERVVCMVPTTSISNTKQYYADRQKLYSTRMIDF